MKDWNDARFFLAVAECGSTLGAAAQLKTSQSTVFRRISALETEIGLRLFHRRPSGYGLTDDGEALLEPARAIRTAFEHLKAAASRQERGLTGRVRFSAPELALAFVLPPVLGQFRARYPNVRLDLVATDRAVDLASGEADVALRGGFGPTDGALFGRRLVYDQPAIGASRAYRALHGIPETEEDLATHSLILPGQAGSSNPFSEWLLSRVPEERIILRPDTMVAAFSAIVAGLGIGPLPRFVIDRHPELVAAPVTLPIQRRELWIVTHERLRDSPSVRALMDFVAAYVLSTQDSLNDSSPSKVEIS